MMALRIVNDGQEVDFYVRLPGEDWKRTRESAEVAGINHNVLGGYERSRLVPASFSARSRSGSRKFT